MTDDAIFDTDKSSANIGVSPLVCTVTDAKQKLRGYSHQRVYDLINSGELKSYREGRRRFVLVSSIIEHIERRIRDTPVKNS